MVDWIWLGRRHVNGTSGVTNGTINGVNSPKMMKTSPNSGRRVRSWWARWRSRKSDRVRRLVLMACEIELDACRAMRLRTSSARRWLCHTLTRPVL